MCETHLAERLKIVGSCGNELWSEWAPIMFVGLNRIRRSQQVYSQTSTYETQNSTTALLISVLMY